MREMLGTRVTFGGTIKRSAMDQLADMMEDRWGEWDGSTAYEELEAAANENRACVGFTRETNYGKAEDFTATLQELGLPYRLQADGNYEFGPQIELWDPAKGHRETFSTAEHNPVTTLTFLIAAQRAGTGIDTIIAELQEFAADPPALVIEEDVAGAPATDAVADYEDAFKTVLAAAINFHEDWQAKINCPDAEERDSFYALSEAIESISTARKVVIEVSGGVAECTSQPPGVNVEIIDHDNAEPPVNEIEGDERAAAARDVGAERYLEAAKILGLTVVGQPEALMEEPK